jgi:hypothetical protein
LSHFWSKTTPVEAVLVKNDSIWNRFQVKRLHTEFGARDTVLPLASPLSFRIYCESCFLKKRLSPLYVKPADLRSRSLSLSLSLSLTVKPATSHQLQGQSAFSSPARPQRSLFLSSLSLDGLSITLSVKPPPPAGVPLESRVSPRSLANSLSLTLSLCRSLSHSSGRRREQKRSHQGTPTTR